MSIQNNGRNSAPQARRRRRAFYTNLSIERRAVVAAGMVRESGWTAQQAAGLCCVNPTYVSLVRQLSDADRVKLTCGELRLAQLWRDYRRRLAERRAQRLAAEREARVQAEREARVQAEREAREARVQAQHEAQTRELDSLFDCVGVDRVIDCFVGHYGLGGAFQALDVNLQQHGRDIVEVVMCSLGPERAMRALDKLTQPHAVAAE
jgi:hypothetical protein